MTAHDLNDFWKLMAPGTKLGSGVYREVFALEHMPDYVIKVEQEPGCFHNVREWDTWQALQSAPKWRRWLAPCLAISPGGLFLIQRRTTPVLTIKEMPAKVPAFLTDRKLGNYGRLDGRIVCHDYALTIVDYPLRQTKGNWWKE